MSVGVKRSVLVAVAGLLWLSGCETTSLVNCPKNLGAEIGQDADAGNKQQNINPHPVAPGAHGVDDAGNLKDRYE